MAIAEIDYKLLWGRAAGLCSNPDCRDDLTRILQDGRGYNVGEMAHIIARSPEGPRGNGEKPDNSYRNLILLCPTCHTHIDKAPSEFPAEMLQQWKADHEKAIRAKGTEEKFASVEELKLAISNILAENKAIWKTFGPQSQIATADRDSNLHSVWELKKLDTIVPNNHRIINAVENNRALLVPADLNAFFAFKIHAGAFERSQFERLDNYPIFPNEFEERFSV